MAKRELTDKEKKILERIGSSEAAQRSRQVLDLYRKKDEADRAYEEAQKKSGFADSGIDTNKYFDVEGADLLAKKKEADAAVAAYEQSNAGKNFKERASRITMKQFEQEFADIEKQKQQLENEKGSLWDALKPGGVTPSEWYENRKEKNAQIKELESKEAKYRAVRDEKKSREETDMLPDDVKELLDRYNAFDTANEGIDLANMFTPAQQKSHAQINSQKLKNEQQKQVIAQQLEKMGYANYKELAEYRKYVTESESTDKFTQEMSDFTEEHPVVSTAANLALMPSRVVTGAMGTFKGATDSRETDLRSNPKSYYYALTRANREKRETIGEGFEDGVLSANTKKFLYETADSALESLAAGTMFGPASGLALGVGAMNESVIDSLESGATNTQALVNGIVAGVFEGLFESFSLGRLKAMKEVPVKAIKDAVKNVGKSILVNFSEEANTELANLIFDTIYNGGTSQYYEAVTALIGQGYSEKEARSRVILDMAKQVGLAGLGGALMGGFFGGYGSAAGRINYNSQLESTGKSIVDEGVAEQIIAGAKDVKENDSLRALAEEIVLNEKNEYSKKEYRNIGKAAELLSEQTSEDSIATIKEAVAKRLEALGETGDIQLKAEAITQTAKNRKLTKKQKAALEQGTYTKRVINELTDKSEEFSSVWADKASEEVDNLYKRRYNSVVKSTEKVTDNKAEKSTEVTEQKVEEYKGVLTDTLLRDGQDKDVLSAAVDLCFEYGRNGGYTLQDAVGSKAISEKIAPEQRKHAYEAGVYQGLKDTANVRYKGDTVSVFVNGFKGKDNISRKSYTSAFDVFYSEGAHTAKSFDEALKANSSLLSYIGNGVAQKAFEQGRKLTESQSIVPAVSRKKPVVLGEYKSKTLEEKEVDVFFESLAKKLGVNITRVQSINAKNGRRANAYVDINKGEVVSSASSDNEYQSTIHESVHIAYAYNAEKMRPVAKAVKEFFISKHSAVKLEETLRSYEQNYEGDRAAAEEEFIADCIAGMFSTDEGVNDFLSWLEKDSGYNAEEKKTILQKLSDWILEIIDAIEELMQGKSLNDVAAEFAKEETARFKEIRQMFLEVLDEVAEGTVGRETKNTAEGGVKMSIKVTRNMAYAEQIEKYFAGELNRSDSLYLGVPSEMLQKTGFSSNPFAMNQGDLRKSNEKTAKNKKYSRHGVPRKFFKNMPKYLNEAVVFIENENGITVVTDYFMLDEKEQVSYVIAGVLQDEKMENDTVNLVKSVYPLDDFTVRITKAAEKGCLVITDKQKAQTILTTVGVQPSEVSRLFELSKDSLSQNIINVKQKQLDIINKVNPAPNTYSTWIRSVDDIKTLAETLEDSDWADADEFNPDLTREMIEDAIEKGEIKVYSSYPIKQGVFVSPSYMEAESYSGDGNVYSKNVSVDDVAWIDPTQGMYVKFSFAGVKAKTANIDTLDAAQRLEDIGKADAEDIRRQTGWFRGMDGMWRFELDDSKMVIRDTDITSGETKLAEVLDYPELFEAYPQLKNVTISAFPSIFRFGVKGSYNSERNEISLSDEFLVNSKVYRELEALKKSDEYVAYKERLESVAREHGEKRLRLSKEFKKIRESKLYTDMVDLLYKLDDEEKVEEYKKAEKEWQSSTLGKRYEDIREELKRMDEVNPQADVEKAFRESELGKRYRELTVDVFGGEVINDKDTRNTLIHEIQHAIQHIEGFASGASPAYWKDINANPFSYTPSEIKQLEDARKKAADYLYMIEDEDIRDDAQRYWYLNEHYFDDNLDTDAVDKEIAEIEARAEAFGYQDKLDRYFELENKVSLTFNKIEKRRKRNPDELYRNTAGEIEARDSTKRLDMTADERKNTRPDIDRKDVVFADGGVSYDFVGHTVDGIEVYETSEEIKALPYAERKKIFSNIMSSQFYGRTAKFFRNGHDYYAKFDESSIDKNIAGDKDSSPKGWRAKINVGADGNIFELVENSLYDHSKPETGKGGAPHKKINYWDYFVKTVQIDNMVYDVLINIRRKNSQDYVYSIRLWENKKIKVSPPVGPSKMSSVNLGAQHSADNISQSNDSVKPSLDWIDFAEQQAKERSAVSKVTELEKINEELRAQIRHPGVKHIVSQLAVQKVARKLKSGYMSKINFHVLADELNTLYGYIANENGLNWANVQIHLESIATKILDESKFKNPDISDYAKEVLRDVRSVKMKLNDRQKAAVASQYGSYNEFRKRMMGTLVLSEEGMSLDERWKELSGAYPIFDSSVADADQPLEMVEVVAALRSTYEDMHGMDYDSAKDMLMTEIYEQYFEVPETKYVSEEYAIKLARAKADYGARVKEAKAEFKRQRDEAYKKARAEYGENLKGIRAEQQEELLKAKTRYNMRAQNIADTRTKEKKRAVVERNVKRLDKLLRSPGKGAPSAGTNKYGQDYVHLTNIPEAFRRAVIDFCSIFIEHDAGVFKGVIKKGDSVTVREKKVEQLRKIYEMMQKSESYLNQTVAEEMKEKIDTVAEIMADRRLSQLSIEEIDTVIEVTDYITASINAQVAVWVDGKKSTVEKEGKAIIAELERKGGLKYIGDEAYRIGKTLGVNNYKPVYFFERVGGPLEKLFLAIQNDGQKAYARNINAAAAFMEGINKKYNYQKWQDEKELVLETVQGHKLKLTKAQAMHIYATAQREMLAGKDAMHLMQGGIVFEGEIEADKVETTKEERKADRKAGRKIRKKKLAVKYKTENGDAHRIHHDDVSKISDYLTAEQKAFIDECVNYLSVDMAALGNEISMELYGIKRFIKKYYIPYNSAKNFIYRKMGENGNAMLKNKSFTKETVFGANNPLVVGDFLEVIVSHIEEMSMYNAMVLPLDYFNRVWNYNDIAIEDDDTKSRKSVRSAMQTAYGTEYVTYVEQLLEDINGGINTDAREKAIDKLTSRFKKAAVLGSASVVIQQPSAVVRAFAEINPIYFAHLPFKGRKEAWERALKYSSTALLKDIGGFDTVSGQSTVDWLTKTEYKGKDKVLKLFTDSEYRDDILAWGPSFADKVTWAHIWKACEKEVRANNRGVSGEAFYEAVGKRFDEVINKTQVYDSVLTRSAHMRSKSSTMKAVTAFMSEPTTQANMLASAAFDMKNGNKGKAVRKISAVVGSQLFNAALVSIIYGARDDDEDETLAEKYISELVNNFLSSLNPLSIIPLYKDVVSIMQGFDVKRADMNIISKFVDAIQKVFSKSDKLSTWDRVSGVIGAAGDIWGIPLTNIIRDSEAVLNVAKNIKGIEDTTGKGILYAISDDFAPELQKLEWYEPSSKDERLYEAFSSNDEKMYNRLAAQYKTGSAIKSALKGQIEDGYLEGKLTDEEAMMQFRRLGFSENEAYYEVRKLKEPVAEEGSEDSNAAFRSFSEMQGIQSAADAELEAERKDAEDEGKTYSADADYTWLRDKLKVADAEGVAEEIKQLKDMGVDESKINAVVKKWLKENDADVQSQADQSLKGNYTSYESRIKRIADIYGVDASTVASAVRSAAGSNSDPLEGTLYALGDLHFAVESGSDTTIRTVTTEILNAKLKLKLAEGVAYDDAYKSVKQGIRTSLISKFKSAYVAGNSTAQAQIRRQLWSTGLWDSLDKLYDTLDGWVDE